MHQILKLNPQNQDWPKDQIGEKYCFSNSVHRREVSNALLSSPAISRVSSKVAEVQFQVPIEGIRIT